LSADGLVTRPLPRNLVVTGDLLNIADTLVITLDGRPYVHAAVLADSSLAAGQIFFEVSYDGGVTYSGVVGQGLSYPQNNTDPTPTISHNFATLNFTDFFNYAFNVGPSATHFQLRVSGVALTSSKTFVLGASENMLGIGTPQVKQGPKGSPSSAWWVALVNSAGTQVAVKAASTAAVAADPALVVALNPLTGVGGMAASGAAKVGNPVQQGGVFNTTQPTVTTGQAVEAQMTARGAQIVATGLEPITVTELPISNIASISFSESVAAPTAATWYVRKQWALPASGVVVPARAFASAATAASRTLIAVISSLGTLNLSTNAFAATNSVASPFFYGRLFGCVTTVQSATATTLTVTYTDELGASSTSGAVVFASASPVGNCFEFPLATAAGPTLDSGVRAITNITDTAAPTGIVTVYGVTTLLESLGTTTTDSTLLDTGRLNANEQIAILEWQTLVTAHQRAAGVTVSIR
jgi:hypothetical protein